MESETEELLSMDEAIERLKTTRPTFYRWLRSGRIKGLKLGRQWRFYPADLERFLQGEQPRVDLPVGIGPLLAELALQLQELEIEVAEVPETAAGALERMLQLAAATGAGSLHLEAVFLAPGQQQAVLRCRIDGVLQTLAEFDRRLLPALIEAAKQRSHCDPHLSDQPQEGQLYYECPSPCQTFDLRTQFLPTALGESLSALMLNRSVAEQITLARIGLPAEIEAGLKAALRRGWGLIVAAGPTGCGKTTTLYAALNEMAGPRLKSITLEAHVEMFFPWVTSLPVQARSGQSFAELIKAAMQADPDLLLVAELRDAQSLQQTLGIALTGHLVLTTLHAPDAVRSLLRLVEVSGNAYSVSEALGLILNQRLVRRLCPECRRQAELPAELLPRLQALLSAQGLGLPEGPFWQPGGCRSCNAGYRGRVQLTEALSLNPELSRALLAEAPEAELRRIWLATGGRSWIADGLAHVAQGDTSLEELLRAGGQ
ncbi:MAG TPA: ATPase, T2SS/T4P/T4SS family [Candidatus Obscuribacterales bacterium]